MKQPYRLLVNGKIIYLPTDNDLFFTETEDKIWSTTMSLPINNDVVEAFQLHGLLVKDDVLYEQNKMNGQIQGNGISCNCIVYIESVHERENTIDIYIEGHPLLGETVGYILDNYYTDTDYFSSGITYPLYKNNGNLFYTGYSIGSDRYITTTPPTITFTHLRDLIRHLGWEYRGDYSFYDSNIQIIPNTLYFNARQKARKYMTDIRFYSDDWPQQDDYHPSGYNERGEYGGLEKDIINSGLSWEYDTDLMAVYTIFNTDGEMQTAGNISSLKFDMHLMAYQEFAKNTAIDAVVFTVQADNPFRLNGFDATYDGSRWTNTVSTPAGMVFDFQILYEIVFDVPYSGEISWSFVNTSEKHTGWVGEGVNAHYKLYTTTFFDDDVIGYRRPTPLSEDYKSGRGEYYSEFIISNSTSFTSSSWGSDRGSDYDGQFVTNYNPNADTKYHESRYNGEALQFTNIFDWLQEFSVKDILIDIAAFYDKFLCFDTVSHEYWFEDRPNYTIINDFIVYDQLEFDDRYTSLKINTANGKTIYKGINKNGIEKDVNRNTTFFRETFYQRWLGDNLHMASDGFSIENPDWLGEDDTENDPYDNVDFLITDKLKNVGGKKHYQISDESSGYILIGMAYSTKGYLTYNYKTYSLCDKGQVVTITYPEYLYAQHVVYKTRTFRILEQEIDNDGVNKLKMVLYIV